MLEFSPVTSSAHVSPFNVEAMMEAYRLLKDCLLYSADEGLVAEQAVPVTRYLTTVYLRLGSVADMPHRALYVAQVIIELTRLRTWLICQVETKVTASVVGAGAGGTPVPSWLYSAPTEDIVP